MKSDNTDLLNVIKANLPSTIWKAQKGHGSFVTFEMGKKIFVKEDGLEKSRGSFCLWLYLCYWSIYKYDDLLIDSNCKYFKDFEFHHICGHSLLDIKQEKNIHSFTFIFENGLKIVPAYDAQYEQEDDLFVFYIGDGESISYSVSKGLYYEFETTD